jgi:hypothetical protein
VVARACAMEDATTLRYTFQASIAAQIAALILTTIAIAKDGASDVLVLTLAAELVTSAVQFVPAPRPKPGTTCARDTPLHVLGVVHHRVRELLPQGRRLGHRHPVALRRL